MFSHFHTTLLLTFHTTQILLEYDPTLQFTLKIHVLEGLISYKIFTFRACHLRFVFLQKKWFIIFFLRCFTWFQYWEISSFQAFDKSFSISLLTKRLRMKKLKHPEGYSSLKQKTPTHSLITFSFGMVKVFIVHFS